MSNDKISGRSKCVLDTIIKTIEDKNLISRGDSVLVALSGGADSVCLTDALNRIKSDLGISLAAVHLNHMIRGEEADNDERFADDFCKALKIPFFSEKADIPKLAEEEGISEELAGRKARYALFRKICEENGYTHIATAHNKNDNAETVLMRIMRGTGTDGLCGIKYSRPDGVIRPLLDINREDIEVYCKENNLSYCTDSTNKLNDYTRNRIRNELIPFIKEKFNPNITDTLCTLTKNVGEDAEFIDGYAQRLYNRINNPLPKRKPTVLDIKTLKLMNDSIKARVIRIAAVEVMGDDYSLGRVHIDAVKNLLDKETGASAPLPGGLVVNVQYGWLEFTKEGEKPDVPMLNKFRYDFEITNEPEFSVSDIKMNIVDKPQTLKLKKGMMLVDFDKVFGHELCVRSRMRGDRIVLYKDGRSKKVKDYFIDEKIPRKERDKIPLLCADKEVAAIIGYRISENYKVSDTTRKGLLISYETKNEED